MANVCSQPYIFDILESSFSGCNLKAVQYVVGVSLTTSFYDLTSGAFVGGYFEDDAPQGCPGTSQQIGLTLAAGVFEVPPSCQLTGQRDPCPHDAASPDSTPDSPPDAAGE